jgi:serine/threonine-protein kinase RsbW
MAVLLDGAAAILRDLAFTHKDIFAARLAIEEAVCNAIKHGHLGDAEKTVEVRYCVDPEWMIVEVEDEGPGFDPLRIPDPTAPENCNRPCGRGLLLIRHYAVWVRHNRQGNCISFCIASSAPFERH